MKKLVYLAMVAFAASMVACGGNKAESTEAPAEEPVAVEEVEAVVEEVADSAAAPVDTVVEAAAAVVE